MPRFAVTITRGVTESAVIEINVETRELAATAALEKLWRSDDARWILDEGSWNDGDATIARVVSLPES